MKPEDITTEIIDNQTGETSGPLTTKEFREKGGPAERIVGKIVARALKKDAATSEGADKARPFLPELLFALHKAASNDDSRPSLCVVRIEPGKAMATDGSILLRLIPGERFQITEPFTVDAEMCNQILKAKALSSEDTVIEITNEKGRRSINVGNYVFLPQDQMDLFPYESTLEQKTKVVGEIKFMTETFDKLVKALKALGVAAFTLRIAGELDPVQVEGLASELDRVSGAIMPARS